MWNAGTGSGPKNVHFATCSSSSSPSSSLLGDATMIATSLGIAASAAMSIYWIKKRLETKKPFEDLPMPPGSHALLGHALKFQGDFQEVNYEFAVQHANPHGLTGYWLLGDKAVAVANLEDARMILLATPHRHLYSLFRHHLAQVFGAKSIGAASGREWRMQRSVIQKAFHSTDFMTSAKCSMILALGVLETSLVGKIKQQQQEESFVVVEMEEICKMITPDSFCGSALSEDSTSCCKHLQLSELATSFDFLTQELKRRLFHPISPANNFYWMPTAANKKFHASRKRLRDYLGGLVKQRRAETAFKDEPLAKSDLLTHIIASRVQNDNATVEPDMDVFVDDLVSLLFGGHDTTAVTLAYAFYVLASRPELEQLVVEEVQRVGYENIDQLLYTKAFLMEVLRLYPVGDHTARNLDKPLKVSNGQIELPTGTFIMIAIYIIQRDEKYFPRPLEFLPERWATRDGTSWKERTIQDTDNDTSSSAIPMGNHKAILTFSAGARNCVGQKYAMQSAMLVIAKMISKFRFELDDPKYKLESIKDGLVCRPREAFPSRLRFENNQTTLERNREKVEFHQCAYVVMTAVKRAGLCS